MARTSSLSLESAARGSGHSTYQGSTQLLAASSPTPAQPAARNQSAPRQAQRSSQAKASA